MSTIDIKIITDSSRSECLAFAIISSLYTIIIYADLTVAALSADLFNQYNISQFFPYIAGTTPFIVSAALSSQQKIHLFFR